MEELKEKVIKAVEESSDEFPAHLLTFISTALRINIKHIKDLGWEKVVGTFYIICLQFPIIDLPMVSPDPDPRELEGWGYEGRTWHLYSHFLAARYGWTLEYISQLQVVEALAKIQEIIADEQMQKEFVHSLSEVAYPYNPQTKKQIYSPLPRPHWMKENKKIQPIKRVKIPAYMMPIGDVNYDAIDEETKPKELIN